MHLGLWLLPRAASGQELSFLLHQGAEAASASGGVAAALGLSWVLSAVWGLQTSREQHGGDQRRGGQLVQAERSGRRGRKSCCSVARRATAVAMRGLFHKATERLRHVDVGTCEG